MRRLLMVAVGLVFLAATAFSAPAQAMAISAPAALKGATDGLRLAEPVYCYGGGCGYYRPYYRPYGYGYYRPYYRPYYRSYYRPYYRSWGGCGGCGYYRPYYRPYWAHGYGYYDYAPRPRYYFGPRVYWW
jgi:hypothetical protein